MPLKSLLQGFNSKPVTPKAGALRIAVLGCGRMGQFHLRHIVQNANARLVGLFDSSTHHAESVARRFRTIATVRPDDLLESCDAVIIATPTPTHFEIAKPFLERGVSCLIEKPLTASVDEAEALIRLASESRAVLQVGHIERFNPAVIAAAEHIDRPQFIEVNRLGPYDPRVSHIGVILDLMIHDLDIVLYLVGKPVTRVEAFGAKVLSNHEDIAKVRLHFEGGCVADLSASRISIKKYRKIRIFQHNAYLSLDYAAPELQVFRKKGDVVKSLFDVQRLKPRLAKNDPLALELDHFLKCVRDKNRPVVSGEDGRDALVLAQEILKQLKVHA